MVGGRLDPDNTAPDALDKADMREAYERGREDERASRRRRPVLMTLLFVAAAVGLGLMVLAAVNGSFGRAGGVVDENLAVAATQAEPVVREAASDAGQSIRDAGSSLKAQVTDQPKASATDAPS